MSSERDIQPPLLPGGILDFLGTVEKESDRGLALVTGEHVNAALADLIRRAMVKSDLVRTALDKPNGLFWAFNARLQAAYLFGLIRKIARQRIEGIQLIRNEAGHTRGHFDLGSPTPKVQEGLKRLPTFEGFAVEPERRPGVTLTFPVGEDAPLQERNRWRLILSTWGLSWYLDDVAQALEAVGGLDPGELPLLLLKGQRARLQEEIEAERKKRAAGLADRLSRWIAETVDAPPAEEAQAPEPDPELPAASVDTETHD